MVLQLIREQLKTEEGKLPFKAKREIAETLDIPYNNVITAFRGIAGEPLTKSVLKVAKRINAREKKRTGVALNSAKTMQQKRSVK